ncbi:MAG: preprotein translocase subunit SecA [bacterium]
MFLDKLFGNANTQYVKSLEPLVEKINSYEGEFTDLSDEGLKEKTRFFKERLQKGASLDEILCEAFALVREAAKRTLDQRPFDTQLMGGIVLHRGRVAEMKTGEGKTLAVTMPLYLNALTEKGCHLVTVNEYLAKRDAVWMGQIYYILGLSTGCLTHEGSFIYDPSYADKDSSAEENNLDRERDEKGGFKVIEKYLRPCSRKEAYAADITYGTNSEFGFDYLRDNMVYDLAQKSQREFNYAVIDEVDSILIDEARTPLIISTPDVESSKWYQEFAAIIPKLEKDIDYEIDEKMRAVTLTEAGVGKIEKILKLGNIYEEKGMKYLHYLEQALRATTLFEKDKDYIVSKNGDVVIVDEFTGRLLPGRRYSGGLHQAIEAKEKVRVQPESLTLASVSFQNYFRMYQKLAGMTGTAATSAEEFDKVYGLEVAVIPTNQPMIRKDLSDKIYQTEAGKFKAVIKEVKEKYERGQPVLVGTTAIGKNELLGKMLEIEGIPHKILNAKNHEKEGEVIAQAGRLKAVTVATNMAGRGVDIVFGGNPPDPEEAQKVKDLGGLHVIGTERHEARRIDNQLRGRSGRQGDPGSSQFFVSMEDNLMRIFGGDKVKSIMEALKIPEDEPIQAGLVSGVIEEAQARIEGFNFDLRKHLLDYDDVMNKHREIFYKKRSEIIDASILSDDDPNGLRMKIIKIFEKAGYSAKDYEEREQAIGKENMRQVAKAVSLRILDFFWVEHLENMEYLVDSVKIRAYGQKDPLVEYKSEGHRMFQKLIEGTEKAIADTVMKAELKPIEENKREIGKQIIPGQDQPGRNDPCPCGAKKPDGTPIKYKKCHGK